MVNRAFWKNKSVLITGHTGFKGSWLALWLQDMGAKVSGYALSPPYDQPSLFESANVQDGIHSVFGDLKDTVKLTETFAVSRPEIVLHLAAQPLVRESYECPVETFETNVMGTVRVLEAALHSPFPKIIINVTSDKCYENSDSREVPFVENDAMGGQDPYSASKGCSELVTASYCKSFFQGHPVKRLASARAGNVIGGGDWSKDRLFPDMMRAFLNKEKLYLRYPNSIRPWQHVLDPLSGYLLLAEMLWEKGESFSGGWNFGPAAGSSLSVRQLVDLTEQSLKVTLPVHMNQNDNPHEASFLKLDSSKAKKHLNWVPKLSPEQAVNWSASWYNSFKEKKDTRGVTLKQIHEFELIKGEH